MTCLRQGINTHTSHQCNGGASEIHGPGFSGVSAVMALSCSYSSRPVLLAAFSACESDYHTGPFSCLKSLRVLRGTVCLHPACSLLFSHVAIVLLTTQVSGDQEGMPMLWSWCSGHAQGCYDPKTAFRTKPISKVERQWGLLLSTMLQSEKSDLTSYFHRFLSTFGQQSRSEQAKEWFGLMSSSHRKWSPAYTLVGMHTTILTPDCLLVEFLCSLFIHAEHTGAEHSVPPWWVGKSM